MNRLGLAALALLFAGCAGEKADGRYYENNDGELAPAYAAIMTCGCIFVMEMPEDFCSAWVKVSPAIARVGIDLANKSVESSAFITFGARAHWVDDKRGCVLE